MQRKVFSADFKAKVAMEALAGRKTVNEIAGTYEVHPNQVTTWKREAQEGLKTLFERKRGRRFRLCTLNKPMMRPSPGLISSN